MEAAIVKIRLGRTYYFADMAPVKDFYSQASRTLQTSNEGRYLARGLYIRGLLSSNPHEKDSLFHHALEIQRTTLQVTHGNIKEKEFLAAILNAMDRWEEAISIVKETGNAWLHIIYMNNIGYERARAGRYKEAMGYFVQSLKLCKQLGNKTLLRNTYENISRVYRLEGDWEKAALYFQLMHLVEESLFTDKVNLEVSEHKVKYDAEKKETENRFLRQNESVLAERIITTRRMNIHLIIASLLILAVLIAVFTSRHKLKLAKAELDKSSGEIVAKNTELENLNRILHAQQADLREAQEAARLANWELNLETDQLSFSDQFQKIFETEATLLQKSFREIISSLAHPKDRQELDYFLSARDTGKSPYELEFRLIIQDRIKWVRAHKVVLENKNQSVVRIFGTVQDITDFKEKERIKSEVAAQQTVTRHLIKSQEEERKRIAGELHDSLGQEILIIKNRALLGLQNEGADQYSYQQLDEINRSVSSALTQVREISYNLRPAHLERLGLTETINSTIRNIKRAGSLNIESDIENIDGLLSDENNINFFRIVQEGLNNIIKHADAELAEIFIRRNEGSISLIIRDNGRGFDTGCTAENSHGFGLANIANRIKIMQGKIEIKSGEMEGTTLEITIPV